MTRVDALNRETFKTSRLLEFCSIKELVAQTGHEVAEWPLVVIKELADNGLDIAEEIGVAPELAITVSTDTGEIIVTDNGPGIPAETINSILDYRSRTSSRAAYCSPSRGQQGNALSTILAIPFVLDGTAGETVIEARGIAHRIRFSADPIRQEPRITYDPGSSTVRTGTRVTVRWPAKACHLIQTAAERFFTVRVGLRGAEPAPRDHARSGWREVDHGAANRSDMAEVATLRSDPRALVHAGGGS